MNINLCKGRKVRPERRTAWVPRYDGCLTLIVPTMDNFVTWIRDRYGVGTYRVNGRRKNTGRWYSLGKIIVNQDTWEVKEGRIVEEMEKELKKRVEFEKYL